MTTGTKVAGVGVGLMAIMTLLVSTQGLQFLQWAFGELKVVAGLPLFVPVTLAMIVGAIAPAWVPHLLPPSWPRAATLRVTRLLGFGIAFVMLVARYPSAIGVQYGLFAGSGSYMLWTVGQNLLYRWVPGLKPLALIDEDSFCETVRKRALEEGRRGALAQVRAWARELGESETQTAKRVRDALGDA